MIKLSKVSIKVIVVVGVILIVLYFLRKSEGYDVDKINTVFNYYNVSTDHGTQLKTFLTKVKQRKKLDVTEKIDITGIINQYPKELANELKNIIKSIRKKQKKRKNVNGTPS